MASDDELWERQVALQAEAEAVLAELDLAAVVGPVLPTGSFVSGLMSWPDLDVMAHVGAGCTPADVLRLLQRLVDRPGVVGFDYRDERGERSPTGTARDDRYHVVVAVARGDREWRVDLTLWLNDPHANVTAWHESLRATITAEQRAAILRIKDVWHRLPTYPDQVGGTQIYAAVLDDGVRTVEEFAAWLAERGEG
ncbi:hypothetical protein KZZ52_34955 [Dactylosporangium sp. AC04546]|uniref:hypothetical protein n=1 Tax=Dactylosporangium sp. AC04546 TaxID=2862460 RepID=UPI001EDED4B8|nr:hypothetical protein [Dactylosporangium sp. AC04546]WVK79170.1 hypothetical protein KZZ52_34955 [Dactylosporangium sp. AC04546]